MRYHYRIKEVRYNPERPWFYIEMTRDGWIRVVLGLADWFVLDGSTPSPTLEDAKKELVKMIEKDKRNRLRAKETKTRYHYL